MFAARGKTLAGPATNPMATLYTANGIPVYRSLNETVFDCDQKPCFYIVNNSTVHDYRAPDGKMTHWIDGVWLLPCPGQTALYFDMFERERELILLAREAGRGAISDVEMGILRTRLSWVERATMSKDAQAKLARQRLADEKFTTSAKAALGDDPDVARLIEQALQEERDATART
jgi:hypothetical protein